MKQIVELLEKNGYIFKTLKEVDKKSLGSRKKVKIYIGTDTDLNYAQIFFFEQKSRFVSKNTIDLLFLSKMLKRYSGHNFKKSFLLLSSDICFKSKEILKEKGWKIISVTV